jgi:hypothetical protein
VELYTAPPPGSTVICADELGPVIPRTFPPAPGWSPGGHRIKAPLEYARGPDKTWVYGGLRVADGQAITMCAPSRNSTAYQDFLHRAEHANPAGHHLRDHRQPLQPRQQEHPGLAGQDFADPDEIAHATRVATAQLNARARPWIWGRPQPKHRSYRRRFIYTL